MHICISKLTIIGSDNGLSLGRRQAIFWTNAGILLIWTLGTNFSEISSEIHAFSFKKMHVKMSSAKGRLFTLGLIYWTTVWSQMYSLPLDMYTLLEPRMGKYFIKWYISVPVLSTFLPSFVHAGISLGMCQANERRRYIVTMSLIGWALCNNVFHWLGAYLDCSLYMRMCPYLPMDDFVFNIWRHIETNIRSHIEINFSPCFLKCCLQNGSHFVRALMW